MQDQRAREGSLSTSQVDDDPLSTKSDSIWNNYFKDNEVKDQIERDVDRTHPDIHFFNNQVGSELVLKMHAKDPGFCRMEVLRSIRRK